MYRQLNSPREIGRRLCFLVYILSGAVFCIELVVTVARPGTFHLSIAFAAFAALSVIRRAGYRWLDFERLFESFPEGCALDRVPEPVREEVERLVVEFDTRATDWVRRTEIRHRLVELEVAQPEIIEAYSKELSRVLAA